MRHGESEDAVAHRPDVSTERRTQIIQAALACFTRKGYVHTTMDDIVAESELSKGTLYWYFKSKDEVFKATIVSLTENVAAESMTIFQSAETATVKLRAGTQMMADFCRDIARYFGLLVEFWSQSERCGEEEFYAEIITPYQQMLTAVFETGIQAGEFRQVDADALAWMMISAFDGLAAYSIMMPDLNLDIGKISKVFIETLLAGLGQESKSE